MKLLSLTCHGCGAPLDVPVTLKSVECEYCASKFAVEVAQVPGERDVAAEPPAEPEIPVPPEVAELRQKLQNLDLEWVQWKARYVTISIDGRFSVPDAENCRMGQFASGVLLAGIIVIGFAAESVLVPLIGVPVLALLFVGFSKAHKDALVYRKSYDRYRAERLQLLVKIDEAEREATAV